MKKLLLCALLGSLCLSLNAVEFDFKGSTSGNGSISYTNSKIQNENSCLLSLNQNLIFTMRPLENLKAHLDANVGLTNYGNWVNFGFNEFYLGIETNGKGNYYFGKRNHNLQVAKNYSFADYMLRNSAQVEALVSNEKWFKFNGGLFYTFNGADLRNFNVFLSSTFFSSSVSYNVSTYFLHCLDFPKGTLKALFNNSELFKHNIKEFQDKRIEFVTSQTLSYKIKDFNIYVESLIRTNPNKYKVNVKEDKSSSLALADKKPYFDTSIGIAYNNSVIDASIEYCYGTTGYSHSEITDINKYLLNNSNERYKLMDARNSYPIFYDNNIALTLNWNINNNWKIMAGDKISFAGFDCDSSYVGTSFYVGGEYSYNDKLTINAKVSGAVGGDNSEYVLFNTDTASLSIGAKITY